MLGNIQSFCEPAVNQRGLTCLKINVKVFTCSFVKVLKALVTRVGNQNILTDLFQFWSNLKKIDSVSICPAQNVCVDDSQLLPQHA